MSDSLYAQAGEAIFMCPRLWKQLGERLWHELTIKEQITSKHEHGHREWVFAWQAGAHHITHKRHSIPVCECGRELIQVAGDDPFA